MNTELTQRCGDAVAGMSPAEARRRAGPYGDGRTPLLTTIRWTRVEDGLPPYGVAVAVWMPKIKLVIRAHRDARMNGDWLLGINGSLLRAPLIAAWAELPDGPLPPPDGGSA